jgi:hypothetical protein
MKKLLILGLISFSLTSQIAQAQIPRTVYCDMTYHRTVDGEERDYEWSERLYVNETTQEISFKGFSLRASMPLFLCHGESAYDCQDQYILNATASKDISSAKYIKYLSTDFQELELSFALSHMDETVDVGCYID